ncbi:hypothetical protein DAEQUDRAFT_351110 [Daedalea quercina L-15889]|uniref:Uncharacterized protein n=1 Tax=Daedalea quercina L-15889 TaxID=1314783 RepID=A0A165TNS9_9APHY|nr:hypothetical protein DAEQUDRAFT_351110 [Daedalea quercina L-15889]
MHPGRRGEDDPRRQSSLPSSLHALIIGPQQQAQDEPPEPSSARGERGEGWDQTSRAFRPVPSFPDPDYTVGSLAPAAFDERDRRAGGLPRTRPAEPAQAYPDDPRPRRPAAAQLPPLQSILPVGTSPPEPALQSRGISHDYSQHLPAAPLAGPSRLPALPPYWEGQAGPSSQPQRHPPPRHGYSYPMPQAQGPEVRYLYPPPQLPPASSSSPPPRYGGYYDPVGEPPPAPFARQPHQPSPKSYSFPQPGPSRVYEAGRGRLPEARSEYGSPTVGHLRRHLDSEGVRPPDDPRRGRSLPPRRSAGASGSRPLPSRLLEPEERGLYPPPYAQPLPYSRGSPVGVDPPGEVERRLSPAEIRTRPGSSRRSVSPPDRRTSLPSPSPEAERPLLHSESSSLNGARRLQAEIRSRIRKRTELSCASEDEVRVWRPPALPALVPGLHTV